MPASQRILVIENDLATREMFEFLLQYNGYSMISQKHLLPEQDIQALGADLVILDWSIHNEPDAHAFLDQLHPSCSTSTIPVIVCTTLPEEHIHQYVALPHVSILRKPFDIDDLLTTIAQYAA